MKEKSVSISIILLIIVITVVMIGVFFYKNNRKETSDNQVASEINEEINQIENQVELVSDDTINDNYIVLYKHNEIDIKTGVQIIDDAMEINEDTIKKYNTTFYNYSNGKYVGETTGKFGIETMTYGENYAVVENVDTIAISKKYNATPRLFEEVKEVPAQLNRGTYYSMNVHSIDLDGDGEEEKIVCTVKDKKDGELVASSEIALYDSNYDFLSKLVNISNGFWQGSEKNTMSDATLLTLENVEYCDIDEDGIMEILIDIPRWEGGEVSIYKYSNGIISGNVDYEVELIP